MFEHTIRIEQNASGAYSFGDWEVIFTCMDKDPRNDGTQVNYPHGLKFSGEDLFNVRFVFLNGNAGGHVVFYKKEGSNTLYTNNQLSLGEYTFRYTLE
jgi:hypothetical protein